MSEAQIVKCPRCGRLMMKGRLYSYSERRYSSPICWAEEGERSWKNRELINVSEDASAYLCKNCWITIVYEVADKRDQTSEQESDFSIAFKEGNTIPKT